MIISTKYDIGHTFWVPRCVIEHSTEEMHFEGETWTRNVETHAGYAKQKTILKVVASTYDAGRKIHIQYYVVNSDDYFNMSQVYSEDDISNYTEEEALSIAKEYEEKQEEYYGN